MAFEKCHARGTDRDLPGRKCCPTQVEGYFPFGAKPGADPCHGVTDLVWLQADQKGCNLEGAKQRPRGLDWPPARGEVTPLWLCGAARKNNSPVTMPGEPVGSRSVTLAHRTRPQPGSAPPLSE
jgi:hypothetical protein